MMTLGGAHAAGLSHLIGSLEVGKRADIVIRSTRRRRADAEHRSRAPARHRRSRPECRHRSGQRPRRPARRARHAGRRGRALREGASVRRSDDQAARPQAAGPLAACKPFEVASNRHHRETTREPVPRSGSRAGSGRRRRCRSVSAVPSGRHAGNASAARCRSGSSRCTAGGRSAASAAFRGYCSERAAPDHLNASISARTSFKSSSRLFCQKMRPRRRKTWPKRRPPCASTRFANASISACSKRLLPVVTSTTCLPVSASLLHVGPERRRRAEHPGRRHEEDAARRSEVDRGLVGGAAPSAASVTTAGPAASARSPWLRVADPPAADARRRAWRWIRARCAVRHRRSRPGACRAVERTSVYSGVPVVGIGSPNTISPCFCSARPAGHWPQAVSRPARAAAGEPRRECRGPAPPLRRSRDARRPRRPPAVSSGIIRRSSFSTTLPGTTLVLVPPSMRPTFRYGCVMPGTLGSHRAVALVLRVQRIQDRGGAQQRVDTRVGDRSVCHLAVDGDFELQAAVVRGHDLVAEAGRDQVVGLRRASAAAATPGRARRRPPRRR